MKPVGYSERDSEIIDELVAERDRLTNRVKGLSERVELEVALAGRLGRENARLREALERIARETRPYHPLGVNGQLLVKVVQTAHEALNADSGTEEQA